MEVLRFEKAVLLLSVMVFSMLAAGCLKVKSVEPADNATNVRADAVIKVIFNKDIDSTTVNESTLVLKDVLGNVVDGHVTVSGKTASFKSASDLAPGIRFNLYILKGIKDTSGIRMYKDYHFSFTTCGNIVVSVDPADKAENVPCGSVIKISFNMDADPSTVNAATVKLSEGSNEPVLADVVSKGKTAYLKPVKRLAEFGGYVLTVTSGVKGLDGEPLLRDYAFSFTTGTDSWSKPERVNAEGLRAYSPHVSMDDNNNALIMWWQYASPGAEIFGNMFQNGMPSTGPFVMRQSDSYWTYGDYPVLAMNRNGRAVAAWVEGDGVFYRLYSSVYDEGKWSAPVAVSNPGNKIYMTRIAINDDGDAIMGWLQDEDVNSYTPRVYCNLLKDGTWIGPCQISNPEVMSYELQVATGGGKAMVVWTEQCRINQVLSFGRVFRREFDGYNWGSPVSINDYEYTIGSRLVSTADPQIIMDNNGYAVMLWRRQENTSAEVGDRYVSRIYKSECRNGIWDEEPVVLSRDGMDATYPKIAMNRFGDMQIMWLEKDQMYGVGRHAGVWDASPEYILTLWICTGSDGIGYHMALDNSGKVLILADGYFVHGDKQIRVFRTEFMKPPASPLTVVSECSSSAVDLRLAADGRGNAIAVWEQESDDKGIPEIYMSEFR